MFDFVQSSFVLDFDPDWFEFHGYIPSALIALYLAWVPTKRIYISPGCNEQLRPSGLPSKLNTTFPKIT
jgi:hypothetical protein